MIQQPRQEEPLDSCVLPIECVTQHSEEEVSAFGVSATIASQPL